MLRTLISEKQLQKRVKELAGEIKRDFKDEDITFICILKGSIYFLTDLTYLVILAELKVLEKYNLNLI